MHIGNIQKVDPENPISYRRVLVSPRVVNDFLNRGKTGQVKVLNSDIVEKQCDENNNLSETSHENVKTDSTTTQKVKVTAVTVKKQN